MSNHSNKNVDKVVYRKKCAAINRHACQIVRDLKAKEAELIRILQEVDQWGVHRFCGYNSLYQYALNMLELTESQACDYIRVARKALEIPQLQKDIDSGELSVSKARRIIPVADAESYREWSHIAKTCSKRELERAIAKKNPKLNVPEHCRIVAPNVYHMQAPINEEVFNKLQRAQEVINQKQQGWVKMNDLLNQVLDVYLDKYDPQRKAERVLANTVWVRTKTKKPTSASLPHAMGKVGRRNNASTPDLGQVKFHEHVDLNSNLRSSGSGEITAKPAGTGEVNASSPDPGQEKSRVRIQNRAKIPVAIKRDVLVRDKYQCQWKRSDGSVCGEKHFIELHHRRPVSEGGQHLVENLVVLCSGHHQAWHEVFAR